MPWGEGGGIMMAGPDYRLTLNRSVVAEIYHSTAEGFLRIEADELQQAISISFGYSGDASVMGSTRRHRPSPFQAARRHPQYHCLPIMAGRLEGMP
ncbi:MAG TPA: hypothetical protein VHJ19_00165 [Gammaproteobacteria bacterium]|nr:hypothetical protein [Gammaproteobacteria bacterium]